MRTRIHLCSLGFVVAMLLSGLPLQAVTATPARAELAKHQEFCQHILAYYENQLNRETNNWGANSFSARRARANLQRAQDNCDHRTTQDIVYGDWHRIPSAVGSNQGSPTYHERGPSGY